ncbi:hypothetical protein GE09DRAFT_81690 [Coniochaeta sp. 2T2.1]|nr:hypothetical protein GE09DRAFT_81690 [Coniochaeta sp. 2T2.1]
MDRLVVRLKRLSSVRHRQHRRLESQVSQYELEPDLEPEPEPPLVNDEKKPAAGLQNRRISKHHLDFALAFTPTTPTMATTPAEPFSPRHASPCSQLEGLPFETQQTILSAAPDLPTLRAMVLASPTLHSVYRQDRMRILKECIDRIIGHDAHATYLTSTETFRRSDITKPMISDFLEEYKESLRPGNPPPTLANAKVRLEDYVQIARFHFSVVEPLTERFATWALDGLAALDPKAPVEKPLSDAERTRIQRAIYRLETFCNLCSLRSPFHMWAARQRLEILCVFPAWEVEEILCIHHFLKERVDSVFNEISELPWPLKPDGRSLITDLGEPNSDMRNYILSRGLTPLLRLVKTKDPSKLTNLLRRQFNDEHFFVSTREDWLDSVASSYATWDRNMPRAPLADNFLTVSRDAQDVRRAELYSVARRRARPGGGDGL